MPFNALRKLAGNAMSVIKSAFDRVANELPAGPVPRGVIPRR
jgi:hypothetical protein